jgi:hypothetical protein
VFTNWLAGGGIRGGITCGERSMGLQAARSRQSHASYDIHATILHLLGLNHENLTFRHNGIDRRLTDVHGNVIQGLLS